MQKIIFEKPDIAFLKKNFALFDMHFHTRYTDGRNRVEAIARRARVLGIGVAITDHNDIRGALELARYRDVPSIAGIEITSREGTHVLVYFSQIGELETFFNCHVRPALGPSVMSSTGLCMDEVLSAASRFDALTVFPHPFCPTYVGICNLHLEASNLNAVLNRVDAIEVINAENLRRWNLKAAKLGRDLQKPVTGGSDGHFLSSLGLVLTMAPCEPTAKAMLAAIRQKRAMVIGKETNLLRKMAAGGAKVQVGVSRYPELLGKNLRFSYRVLHATSCTIRDRVKVGVRAMREDRAGWPL